MFRQTRKNGNNYADNVIDSLLSFEQDQTWSSTIGTGTARTNNSLAFEGNKSLFIQNTDPTNDLEVTNTAQSTIIPVGGTFQLSCYLRKDDLNQQYTGHIEIFRNGTTYSTQSFEFGNDGSDPEDPDTNEVWTRFVSDIPLEFLKNDEITIKIQLDGIVGYLGATTDLQVDGIMLNLNNRNNKMPPIYTKPVNLPVVLDDGWQSRFQATTQSLTGATNNLITIVGSDESNGELTLLDVNGKVTPVKLGDYIGVDFACTIVTPAGASNYITVDFISNGNVYRSYTHSLLKGSGNDDTFSITANLPVGSDLFNNGLEVYITPNTGIDIKDKYIAVGRLIIGK